MTLRPSMRLGELVAAVPGATICAPPRSSRTQSTPTCGPEDVSVFGVTHDSRAVRRGDLFVALPGARVDGRRFTSQAIASGAAAVAGPVVSHDGDCAVPYVSLPRPRPDMARLAAKFHGDPSRSMALVGVTGTNGKTTVTTLLAGMMRAAGLRVGLVGTAGHRIGDETVPTAHTTPESTVLQALLADMLEAGVGVAAMEVSSIGLAESRVDAVEFAVAAFLNLSSDHLDYHRTVSAYAEAKAGLFEAERLRSGVAIIDPSSTFGAELVERVRGRADAPTIWVVGQAVRWRQLVVTALGVAGTVETPMGDVAVRSPLVGRFNAANIAVAAACGLAAGLPIAAVEEGLANSRVRGRMQRVADSRSELDVFVDYAHTADALERVIDTLRELTRGRIWCVFGCGGDRDAGKRGPMGIAAARADAVVVTSDNPRFEDPAVIAREAAAGALRARPQADMPATGHTCIVLDRAAAIATTIDAAAVGDTVLIAGKGHETYQEVAGIRRDFDDVNHVRDALTARARREGGAA